MVDETYDNVNMWDDIPEEDFFNQTEDTIDVDEVSEEKDNDSKSEKDKESKDKSDKSKSEDVLNFFDEESETVPDEEDDKSEQSKDDLKQTSSMLNWLKDNGYVSEEDDKPEDIDENEYVKKKLDDVVKTSVEQIFQTLPESVKQLNRFVIQGGNLEDFLEEYGKNTNFELRDDLDITDESNQEKIVRAILKQEDEDIDDATIETQIELLKDSNRLGTFAEKKFNIWKKKKEAFLNELNEKQERIKQQQEQELINRKRELFSTLNDSKDFNFTKEDKKDLPSYLHDKNFKLDNGVKITQFQADLFGKVFKNPKSILQIASLVRNIDENGNLKFDTLLKKIETQVTKKIKNNIQRSKSPKDSGGYKEKNIKPLIDYFN